MSLATLYSLLFNFILATNRYPRSWKIVSVIPLHKSGPTYDISNYRPIAILLSVSKVFENIIHSHLYTYLESKDLLFSRNSGFRKHHSTTSNLLEVSHKLLHAKDNGYSSRMVFLDISKAFDKVVHSGLLFKLQQLLVSGSFFNLMEPYLLGRSQFVQISNAKSDTLDTNCRVPQGSVLGPVLFLVYVNNVSENIKSSISLFADDTVLSCSKCPYNLHSILSSDLKTLQSWADLWSMSFNASRTKAFTISSNVSHHPPLQLANHILSEVDSQPPRSYFPPFLVLAYARSIIVSQGYYTTKWF